MTRACNGFFFLNWTQIDFKRSPQSRPSHGFRPKRNHFRGQSSRWVLFGHAGCRSIAKNTVSVHAGTLQVDFEVDRPPPAPPGHLLITMVKEAVFCTKNEFRKMKKKVVSLIDLKVMKTRNDCEIAYDCVKRANVVLHVGLCKEIFARKHTATHKPTYVQPLYSYQRDIHTYIHLTRWLVAMEPPGFLWQT